MKSVSEQIEALAVDLRRRGVPYDEIATAIGYPPWQARKIVARALNAQKWQSYPELALLSRRAATALMRLGVYTKTDAVRLILSGRAHRYPGIGRAVIHEICSWCGLELIELKQHRYCVKGQMDREELVADLEEKIRVAERNLKAWRQRLADLEFRTGTAPDGENYDEEWQRLRRRLPGADPDL